MTEPTWDHWRSFLAAVRAGSLSGAARALSLTQPTLGRHLDALEADLGVALFTRSPSGLNPTPIALTLVPHAEIMAAAADNLKRTASGELAGDVGTVRVTASEIVGACVLPAILADFHRAHPGITVELSLSNRNEDLVRRDADIAVRMARPEQGALVARQVGSVAIGLYAHRRYLAAHGTPETLAALTTHTFVGSDRLPGFGAAVSLGGAVLSPERFALRCDSDVAQLAAVRAGIGIGVCQHGLARDEPELVPVLPDEARFTLEMWVVTHEDLRGSRRVRRLFDHLVTRLGAYAQVEGPTSARVHGRSKGDMP